MKKTTLVAIICCVLPIAVIVLLFALGGERVDHSTMPQQVSQNKDNIGTAVGNIFPAFSVVDVDSTSITNEILRGKLAIIWFTTTWCTPCQIGAQKVAELNKELGKPLNVLVFFVDPRESENDLKNWRAKYADADWRIAFNNGLAEKIGIKFLDSKYFLDKEGVVKNFDTQLVNQQYLDLLKSTIK